MHHGISYTTSNMQSHANIEHTHRCMHVNTHAHHWQLHAVLVHNYMICSLL